MLLATMLFFASLPDSPVDAKFRITSERKQVGCETREQYQAQFNNPAAIKVPSRTPLTGCWVIAAGSEVIDLKQPPSNAGPLTIKQYKVWVTDKNSVKKQIDVWLSPSAVEPVK